MKAKLRVYIIRRWEQLKGFEDSSAIMFLSRCVTPEYIELVLTYTRLKPCLTFLATYCANEEMYCNVKLEDMKVARKSKGYRGDKELINYYDRKIIEIMSINNSYQVNFSTVKQLIHKLSSETIKNQLRACLEDVKKEKKDLFNTDNYLITLRQLLNMVRSYIDKWPNTQALIKVIAGTMKF